MHLQLGKSPEQPGGLWCRVYYGRTERTHRDTTLVVHGEPDSRAITAWLGSRRFGVLKQPTREELNAALDVLGDGCKYELMNDKTYDIWRGHLRRDPNRITGLFRNG